MMLDSGYWILDTGYRERGERGGFSMLDYRHRENKERERYEVRDNPESQLLAIIGNQASVLDASF